MWLGSGVATNKSTNLTPPNLIDIEIINNLKEIKVVNQQHGDHDNIMISVKLTYDYINFVICIAINSRLDKYDIGLFKCR